MQDQEFSSLRGKIITALEVSEDKTEVKFATADGEVFKLYHEQDCCEQVALHEVVGNLEDLIGNPLLEAEASSNQHDTGDGRTTWTFYKLGTIKGHVNLRWLGTSNGYYSEAVSFVRV